MGLARGAPAARRARIGGEMSEKAQPEISPELMEVVRRVAEEQGRSAAEVVEAAVRSYVVWLEQVHDPDFLFDRIAEWQRDQGTPSPSEDDAMRLANEELHALRRERGGGR